MQDVEAAIYNTFSQHLHTNNACFPHDERLILYCRLIYMFLDVLFLVSEGGILNAGINLHENEQHVIMTSSRADFLSC